MARKCRHCRTELPPVKQCTDIVQRKGFCGIKCLGDHSAKKNAERMQKACRKEKDETQKAKRERLANDLSHQKGRTQYVFNAFIRALDDGQPCGSCGKYQCGSIWDAGHVRSVASAPELRYDPRNCFRQGSGCNRGNRRSAKLTRRDDATVQQEYKRRIAEKYGQHYLDWLEGPHEPKHYTIADLKAIRTYLSAEKRRIDAGEGPSRDWRGLDYDFDAVVLQSKNTTT